MKRSYTRPETVACRVALSKGFLVKTNEGRHWSFHGRRFNPGTVNSLIASGEAVRIGDRVVAAEVA